MSEKELKRELQELAFQVHLLQEYVLVILLKLAYNRPLAEIKTFVNVFLMECDTVKTIAQRVLKLLKLSNEVRGDERTS